MQEGEVVTRDLESERDELKALLTQVTTKADENETLVFEKEETIENLRAKLEDSEIKLLEKMTSEQQLRDQLEQADKGKMTWLLLLKT